MQRVHVVKEVMKKTGIEYKDVRLIIDSTIEVIKNHVSNGETIEFRNFGKFYPKKKGAQIARDLKTLAPLYLPERMNPAFKPSKTNFKIKTNSHV